jgi:hypothetical protein
MGGYRRRRQATVGFYLLFVVAIACLLIAVVFLAHLSPQLLYNFIYKEPAAGQLRSLGGAVDALRFMCSRDLTIAQVGIRDGWQFLIVECTTILQIPWGVGVRNHS